MITKKVFDSSTAWVLRDGELAVRILEFGCAVQSLRVPAPGGESLDVCLGYDNLKEYETAGGSMGAVCGRHANRIGGAAFTLDGQTFHVTKNDGENHLHGGLRGFDRCFWTGEPAGERAVRFHRRPPHGEEGFPGNLDVWVTYALRESRTLEITYEAVSDRSTVLNLTNHTYFNLNGHDAGEALDHTLWINAEAYTENDDACLPTGRLLPVAGSAFDLRRETPLRERLTLLKTPAMGFDQNLVLNGTGFRSVALLRGDRSGLSMEVLTDQPGLQLYTGGFLTERPGKEGAVYRPQTAVCLETQHFPNATNCPTFPSVVLPAGESYHSKTCYRFSQK